ncbi:MAG: betaine-aldehyde dehydrogenase [Proteobacteria bacterium]|nr:betaine-aldehyde dehydrogenase [Pseudomonadota bacterium]MDA1064194.1 betaine-aldehyde dehydrogenase [Pseudomonadota bacterium]
MPAAHVKYSGSTTLPTQQNYIGGRYVNNQSGATFVTCHPGNDQAICEVETAGEAEVNAAVAAAKAAFEGWSATRAVERGNILRRAAKLLRERNDEIAALETLDTGKPIAETVVVDVATGADVIEYFAGVAQTIHGQHIDLPPAAFAMIRREPLGVVAGIGAWNYPIQIAMWKSGPALACGNTMVFKPAEQTPLTALKLAEIYTEAGMPPGVFNVVQGAAATGKALISHTDVAKVTLTGSVETGKVVMASAASDLKKVTLELGGKSPILIFDDASLDNALNAALVANFYSTGQVCSNGTRVFVQDGIYDTFVDRLAERAKAIRVGDPFDPQTQMGPLVSREHYDKVCRYMAIAKKSKARHVCGGEIISKGPLAKGLYVTPAIFADCSDDMEFVREEVFGPLMSVLSFKDEDEAIARANATHFGLAGAVFTRDFARAHRVATLLQAGIVWINDYNITPPEVPFGGYKQSGVGRENGLQAIEHYTQVKTIYANLGDVAATY